MGMKYNSKHFPQGYGGGGPSKRIGCFSIDLQLFAKMPEQKAQLMHIFRKAEGHLEDTPNNRRIYEDISDDVNNFIGDDGHGNNLYSRIIRGREYWVYERNGIIQNAGCNGNNYRYHNKKGKKYGNK